MSIVRLLVLGIVKLRGETHGYALTRELASWRVETWTSVQPGSIYHALKQLTKEGKLRAVGTEESAEGPGRTLYRLTRDGAAEFRALLEAALSSFDLQQLGAGVAFMQTLPRARVVHLLREQQRRASENRVHLTRVKAGVPDRGTPPHTRDLLELWSGALAATAAWTQRLAERIEAGEYTMADEESSPESTPVSASVPTTVAKRETTRETGLNPKRSPKATTKPRATPAASEAAHARGVAVRREATPKTKPKTKPETKAESKGRT